MTLELTNQEREMLRAMRWALRREAKPGMTATLICRGDQVELLLKVMAIVLLADHDAEQCEACLKLGYLPHDVTTCGDFEGRGDHCILRHSPETW